MADNEIIIVVVVIIFCCCSFICSFIIGGVIYSQSGVRSSSEVAHSSSEVATPPPTTTAPGYILPMESTNEVPMESTNEVPIYKTLTQNFANENTGYIPMSNTNPEFKEITENLPSVFRIDYPLDPTDQYDVSSCVPSQILDFFTYYYWKRFNKEYRFSRLFTFYYARKDNGKDTNENSGTSEPYVYKSIRERGLLLEKYYTYDGTISTGDSGIKNTCRPQKFQEEPQNTLLERAIKNIPKFEIENIPNDNLIKRLKSAINKNIPVLFAISMYESYHSSNTNSTGVIIYPNKSSERKLKTGHMVSLWGWDDDKQIFHLRNTHGPGMYNRGWCTIPYSVIQDNELSGDFQIIKISEETLDIKDDDPFVNMDDWVFRKDLGCVYVNTVQKGVECYNPPPQGYDWTTQGGVLIGKVCPSGTNDSGTTCWYDRGIGRIPNKRACEEGYDDDGTSCWKHSYPNGIGTTPRLNDCPSGSKDVGGTCWLDSQCKTTGGECNTVDKGYYNYSWGSANCTGGRGFRFQGYDDCYKTWIVKLETECKPIVTTGCPYVTKNIGDRGSSCGDGQSNVAGLCYNNCKNGYHFFGGNICEPDGGSGIKKTLFERQYCNDDEELRDGLCYKKCMPGFNGTATICDFSKDVKPGNKKNLVSNCK